MKKSLKFILLLLIAINTESYSQEIELYDIVKVISSENPESSIEDLKFLEKEIKNKQIISIGESTHGTREFALMRHKIFKYLVLNHGFNTIFLEDDYSRCLLIDEYIKGIYRENNVAILQELGKWPWITEEMESLISWMKLYNQEHPDNLLSFVGVDMQDGNHMIQQVNRLLYSYNLSIVFEMPKEVKDKIYEQWSKSEAKVFNNNILLKLNQLIESIHFSEEDLKVVLSLKRSLEQYKNDHANYGNRRYRDFCMGENIIYAMQNRLQIKGLYIAHNGHIAKVYKKRKSIKRKYGFAGGVLDAYYGDKHFSIAQEFDLGSFNAFYTKKGSNDLELMEVTIEKSIDNSIASEFRNANCSICYIPMEKVLKIRSTKDYIGYKEYFYNHTIGARFYPTKNNEKQTLSYIQFADDNFDAFILFKESTASRIIMNK